MRKFSIVLFITLVLTSSIFAKTELSEIRKYSVDTLYSKIKLRDADVLGAIRQKKINLNRENVLGYTVLSYAAIDNNLEIVRLLLEGGAKPDAGINFPLYEVCWVSQKIQNRFEVINLLLNYGANINKKHRNTTLTPLMATIKNQHGEYATFLVLKGAKVNIVNDQGENALMLAIDYKDRQKDEYVIKTLLEHGADVNVIDKSGNTALSIACYNGDERVVQLLLENKASVAIGPKNKNEIPVLNACYSGSLECVKLLLKYGADINVKDSYGSNALITSCIAKDNPELVKLCLSYGADVNYVDPSSGNTAFMMAAIWNHPKQMDVLFENGANTSYENPEIGNLLLFIIGNGNKVSNSSFIIANELGGAIHGIEKGMFLPDLISAKGVTPRRVALCELNRAQTKEKQDEYLKLLELCIVYSYKEVPVYTLHEAVVLNKVELVKQYLESKNGFFDTVDVEGYTPLAYAKKYDRKEIENLLVSYGVNR